MPRVEDGKDSSEDNLPEVAVSWHGLVDVGETRRVVLHHIRDTGLSGMGLTEHAAEFNLGLICDSLNGCLADRATMSYVSKAIVLDRSKQLHLNAGPGTRKTLLTMRNLSDWKFNSAIAYALFLDHFGWTPENSLSYHDFTQRSLLRMIGGAFGDFRSAAAGDESRAVEALVRGICLAPNAKTEEMTSARFHLGLLYNTLEEREERLSYDRRMVGYVERTNLFFPGLNGDHARHVQVLCDMGATHLLNRFSLYCRAITGSVPGAVGHVDDPEIFLYFVQKDVLETIRIIEEGVVSVVEHGSLSSQVPPEAEAGIFDFNMFKSGSGEFPSLIDQAQATAARAVLASLSGRDFDKLSPGMAEIGPEIRYDNVRVRIVRQDLGDGSNMERVVVMLGGGRRPTRPSRRISLGSTEN